MSKIGRKPIKISTAKVEIKENKIFINGPKTKFVHVLPDVFQASLKDGFLNIQLNKENNTRQNGIVWGLQRALLANMIKGVESGFQKQIKIEGLGYKALLTGRKLSFSLGYSHKIDYDLPVGVDVEVDKTGQILNFKSADKLLLGNVCDAIREFRPPEPYKGTGILVDGEVIIRKAGKTKAAAAA
jgi:large subunit ribosomal protein L6